VAKTADIETLWRAGKLRYKLKKHPGQLDVYDMYRKWEQASYEARKREEKLPGKFPRIFVLDISRRWGKDYFSLVLRIEDAIRRPGAMLTYGTALQKNISGILAPMLRQITEDCPSDVRPEYRQSTQGQSQGFYFPNGSVIKLVGIDRNPNGLRGFASDGITISEAGFVDYLQDAISSVLMPQLQGRLHATIVLNSTPPEVPGHAWDEIYCPEAKQRGAYVLRTIDDNPLLTSSEKQEFIDAAGGPESEKCRREYYCERIRSESRVVLPEFNRERHVKDSEMPQHYHAYTCIDPGVQDLCAVTFSYWDFERAKLVIRGDWARANAPTNLVAAAIREGEEKAYGAASRYFDKDKWKANPYARLSDTDLRLITDLSTMFGLAVSPVSKDSVEASLHALRNAFMLDLIEIHPSAEATADHLENAIWNKGRTSWDRHEVYGHFDLLDCVRYTWRHCQRAKNPNPPLGVTLADSNFRDALHIPPGSLKQANGRDMGNWAKILPGYGKLFGKR
jgi:hypothetical protein